MADDERPRRIRWWWLAAPSVTLGAVAVVVWIAALDTTTPVSRDDIVSLPGEGGEGGEVYSYRTVGFEGIDALGGARHEYPETTFLTIREGVCGPIARWDALRERWAESGHCRVDGGLTLERTGSYHRWFGQGDLQSHACAGSGIVIPLETRPLTTTFTCVSGDKVEEITWEVVGADTVDVGDEAVDVVMVRTVSRLSGSSRGEDIIETWYLPGTALVVRRISSTDSVSDSLLGEVEYTERYEIVLTSLTPLP
jgi:hypothetical protein